MTKQYVNLTYDAQKRHGRTVSYRVKATPATGRRVKWILEADPNNTDLKHLAKKDRARSQNEETAEDRQGYFRNTLFLPHVGGDKSSCRATAPGNLSSGSWRPGSGSPAATGDPGALPPPGAPPPGEDEPWQISAVEVVEA